MVNDDHRDRAARESETIREGTDMRDLPEWVKQAIAPGQGREVEYVIFQYAEDGVIWIAMKDPQATEGVAVPLDEDDLTRIAHLWERSLIMRLESAIELGVAVVVALDGEDE